MDVQTDLEHPEDLGPTPPPRTATPDNSIRVENKVFAPTLARATGAALRGSTIPILECALLVVADGIMMVESTNMEMTIRQELPARGSAAWKAAINIQTLNDISRRLASDADISLERDDQSVVLKSGGSRIVFRTLAIENFPVFREASYPCEFSVKGADLGLLLSRAAPFISNDASRYDLSGIHLSSQVKDGAKVMRAAATNGNQLAAAFLSSPFEGEMPEVIIPKQMVIETMKLLDDAAGDVAVSVNHNMIRVVSGSTTIVSKLIDARFPEIERVIPRSNPNILRVDTKAFMRALSIVSVMAERKGIRLVKMDIEQLSMTISSRDTEAGEGVEVLSQGAMEYEGAPLTVAFQPAYLADVAKLCGQTTEFRFADAASPFSAGNPGDDSAIYVAMGARF